MAAKKTSRKYSQKQCDACYGTARGYHKIDDHPMFALCTPDFIMMYEDPEKVLSKIAAKRQRKATKKK